MINSEQKERLVDSIALLNIPGVGRTCFTRLVKKFGSPGAVFEASIPELESVSRVSRALASTILDSYDLAAAKKIASRVVQMGWSVLYPDSSEYPKALALTNDAPPLLFRVGQPGFDDDQMIAIVGTRHATENGRRFAYKLGRELAEQGMVVVSGMAEGIDSAAHRGALGGRQRTIAVWGTPLNVVFPASNRELAEKIRNSGTIYSEYLPGVETRAGNFPERNRIISGLSEGVVVIEAGEKSGALITAQNALDQGKSLFAVPGSPDATKSIGTNHLIKQGAKLLTCISDIFDDLPRLKTEVSAKKFRQLPEMPETELRMVDLLTEGPLQVDQLCRETELPVGELLEFLLALELKGVVQELSGKRFVLTEM